MCRDAERWLYRLEHHVTWESGHAFPSDMAFEDKEGVRKEMRLCYFMIGHRPRAKGKWLFGRFAPMIRREDFVEIMSKARKKGWIT